MQHEVGIIAAACVTASVPTAWSIISFFLARKNQQTLTEHGKAIAEVKVSVNGRLEELLRITRALAFANGLAAGIAKATKEKQDA
jgi:hypothetical protein